MNYDPNVYEIQRYLWVLFENGEPIPPVLPDGYFGESTKAAVEAYQRLAGLPITGKVDHATWDAIFGSYLYAVYERKRSCGIYPFETRLEGGCLTAGDCCDVVYILQVILQTLGERYAEMQEQPINGIYDETTARNVAIFQRKNTLFPTGEVDKDTWNRLAEAYNHLLNRE